jgi:hypothetical protein
MIVDLASREQDPFLYYWQICRNADVSLHHHNISEALNVIIFLLYYPKPWYVQRGFVILVKKFALTVFYVIFRSDVSFIHDWILLCIYVIHNFQ